METLLDAFNTIRNNLKFLNFSVMPYKIIGILKVLNSSRRLIL